MEEGIEFDESIYDFDEGDEIRLDTRDDGEYSIAVDRVIRSSNYAKIESETGETFMYRRDGDGGVYAFQPSDVVYFESLAGEEDLLSSESALENFSEIFDGGRREVLVDGGDL